MWTLSNPHCHVVSLRSCREPEKPLLCAKAPFFSFVEVWSQPEDEEIAKAHRTSLSYLILDAQSGLLSSGKASRPHKTEGMRMGIHGRLWEGFQSEVKWKQMATKYCFGINKKSVLLNKGVSLPYQLTRKTWNLLTLKSSSGPTHY